MEDKITTLYAIAETEIELRLRLSHHNINLIRLAPNIEDHDRYAEMLSNQYRDGIENPIPPSVRGVMGDLEGMS